MTEQIETIEVEDIPEKAMRPIRVKSSRDALRLLTRVMMQLQKRLISDSKAKTIAYCVNSYVKALETSEIEKRIEEIESKIQLQEGDKSH